MLGIPYTIQHIAELSLAQDLFQGQLHPSPLKYVAFDSRVISHGAETLFVALETEHRDGHDFISDAYAKGVRNFLVHRSIHYPAINYVLAHNTLEALQLWACNHRKQFTYPVVSITGSNGKTTVKEWLATLLEWEFDLVKSPLSYNSQLGVPISVLQLRPQATCALIEAGLSQQGEMEILAEIIQPTLGILTHMGDAHEKGFPSFEAKLAEKCDLFESVSTLICGSWQPEVLEYVSHRFPHVLTAGPKPDDHFRVETWESHGQHASLQLREGSEVYHLEVPLFGQAALENLSLAIAAARTLGLDWEALEAQLHKVQPLHMRSEIITDNPEITLINDSYNSDVESVRTAFHMLDQMDAQPHKLLVLTDMHQQGKHTLPRLRQLYEEAVALFGKEKVLTVGPLLEIIGPAIHYPSTDALLRSLEYEDFVNHCVLLKGARQFKLERIVPLLTRKQNAALLQIDLDALVHNFKYLKSRLPEETRTMCVVKASSYGNGTWEIARELELAGTDYLAVAYTSEGVALRESQVELPIMVMNPDASHVQALLQFDLEPEVSSFYFLDKYLQQARISAKHTYRIHLKLETGMGRLGFIPADLERLCIQLAREPQLEVVTALSHLAAADAPEEDEFTHLQVSRLSQMYQELQRRLGIAPMRHILNSKGVLRFPEYAFEMVRLGAGLYGINTTDVSSELQEIGRFSSTVSQVRDYPAGVSIGYGRAEYTQRPTRIATVALGYADGIPRNLGCGAYAFLVHGAKAPIFGRICMDMTMIDVTDIPGVQAGNEVVVFGEQNGTFLSVEEMAKAAGTIPYEILVRISPRVRRMYMRGK